MSRRRVSRAGSRVLRWLGVASTAALVVVAGFSLGVVVGLATEDPGLVLDYATGRTDPVAWDAVPAEPGATAPSPEPAVASAPRPAEPLARSGFSIQVGAFAELVAAQHLARELEEAGFSSYVTQPELGETTPRYRVRVGPLETRGAAEELAGVLKKERGLPTWILEEKPS